MRNSSSAPMIISPGAGPWSAEAKEVGCVVNSFAPNTGGNCPVDANTKF